MISKNRGVRRLVLLGALLCISPARANDAQMGCDVEPFGPTSALRTWGQCPSVNRVKCDPASPSVVNLPSVISPNPDGYLHLRFDTSADRVQVRVDGQMREPLYIDEPELGGLWPVEAIPDCALRIDVRPKGQVAFTHCASVQVERPLFVDRARDWGINVEHDGQDFDDEEFPISTGVAVGDIDNDGDPDLFVGNFGLPAQLFRNDGLDADGRLKFVDISIDAGIDGLFRVAAANFTDVDGDGRLDLYVGRDGADVLWLNRGTADGITQFADATKAWGLDQPGNGGDVRRRTAGVTFGDYDGDGRPDLYLSTHQSYLNDTDYMAQDRLFWHAGDRFVETTALFGEASLEHRTSFAAMWLDIDGDGDSDLLVSSDHDVYASPAYSKPGLLFRNDGPRVDGADGREWVFTEVGQDTGFSVFPDAKSQGLNAMGMDAGDVDGDGTPELALSNIGPNVLLKSTAKGPGLPLYKDVAQQSGVSRTYLPWHPETPGSERRGAWQDMSVTWGVHFLDADNDADLDLFMAGGSPPAGPHVHPMFGRRPLPNAYFENLDSGQFAETTQRVGLADPLSGMGSALADFDNDGWVDLVVSNYRGPLRLFHNQGAQLWPNRRSIQVELVSAKPAHTPLGAVVRLTTADGARQRCDYVQRPGLSGGTQPTCQFGMNEGQGSRLEVTWNDGGVSAISDLPENGGRLRCSRLSASP